MNKPILSILSALIATALAGCGGGQEHVETLRPALVIQVQPNVDADRNVYSGEVRARHEVDLAFRIGGKLITRQVEIGGVVKAGEILARLDPADSALNAESAKAQAAAGETEYRYAKAELARYATLLEKKFISQAVYDAKLNAFNAAKARYEQASSQAVVAGNQAGYATLRADRAGVITAVNADPGQVVAAGQPMFRLAQPEEKEVVVAVPENRLAELRASPEVAIRLWAEPTKIYRGKVREISPNADAATRTFIVKASVFGAGPEVRLGMTASVLFNGAAAPSVLLPLAAVTQKDGQASVWVVEGADNKVAPRPVKLGSYREDGVTVVSGLSVGERIVAAGVHKLLPGQAVRPLPQAAATARP